MRDYAVTPAIVQPQKQTPVYVNRADAFRVARRRAAQTGMAQRVWVRTRAWLEWEKLEEIGGREE